MDAEKLRFLQQYGSTNSRLLDHIVFQDVVGSPGATRVIQQQRSINLLVVSVTQGAVDIYLGDYGSGQVPLTPHLHFGQSNSPVWLPIPEGWHTMTVVASGNAGETVLACVLFGGP